ncbi:hypothetical protein BCR35DRAFT_349755 [Leucosporidium creatinivorum]|uniref:Uncharacterized protein n=1 Tax=Leucosporidium creatinivorum TaxID=106004 RepID=A0A1Y2G1R9_9BASI|nr:hypothetical protein BCR35DRAFT_349755 [Leucosporidium creatinivorum]
MSSLAHRMKARLYDPPLARLFLVLTATIAVVICLLQGEALHTSREGVAVLQRIADAPKQTQAQVQQDQSASSISSLPRSSSDSSRSFAYTVYSPTTTASPANSPASAPIRWRTTVASSNSATSSVSARPAVQTEASNAGEDGGKDVNSDQQGESERRRRQLKRDDRQGGFEEGFSSLAADEGSPVVDGTTRFTVDGVRSSEGQQLVVTAACAKALRQSIIYIERMHTMAFTFIFFEAWTFALSVVGLFSESRPHLVAVLVAHALAGIYAVFQVTQTKHFHAVFHNDISEGACAGSTTFIPGFWRQALSFQLGVAIVQGLALPLVALVSYKLADRLKWTTFHNTSADRRAARVHTLRLIFEIALLLAAFFVIASQSIWLHELFSYPWSTTTRSSSPRLLGKVYRGFLIAFTVLLGPLIATGWLAVTKQKRWLLLVFLAGNLAFLAHALFLTTQRVYMMTSSAFRFLTFLRAVAVVFTSATLVIGIICLFHLDGRDEQQELTVDWMATAFPSELSLVDPRAQRDKLDLEKALDDAQDAASELSASLLPDPRRERETIFITLPKNTRRVASIVHVDDGGVLPTAVHTPTNSFSSPTHTPSSSLSRQPSTSTSSLGSDSFSSDSSSTRSRPKPLLRINTTFAAQANHKSLKGIIAINPDAVVLLEGGDLGAGFGAELEAFSFSDGASQQRGGEQSRWSQSTKAQSSVATRRSRNGGEKAPGASHWSISTKATTTEAHSPSVAGSSERGRKRERDLTSGRAVARKQGTFGAGR